MPVHRVHDSVCTLGGNPPGQLIGQCQQSWPLIGPQWSVTDVGVTPGTLVGLQSGPGHHHYHYIRVIHKQISMKLEIHIIVLTNSSDW